MVQTNTVQGPGGEAGVMRIKGTGTRGSRTRPGDGARRQRPLVLSRSQAGRDARRGRSCAQGGLHRRDAGGGHQLPELRQSGEAGDHGAAFAAPSTASPRPAPRWARPSPAATFRSTTRPAAKAFIPRRCSASSAFSRCDEGGAADFQQSRRCDSAACRSSGESPIRISAALLKNRIARNSCPLPISRVDAETAAALRSSLWLLGICQGVSALVGKPPALDLQPKPTCTCCWPSSRRRLAPFRARYFRWRHCRRAGAKAAFAHGIGAARRTGPGAARCIRCMGSLRRAGQPGARHLLRKSSRGRSKSSPKTFGFMVRDHRATVGDRLEITVDGTRSFRHRSQSLRNVWATALKPLCMRGHA